MVTLHLIQKLATARLWDYDKSTLIALINGFHSFDLITKMYQCNVKMSHKNERV